MISAVRLENDCNFSNVPLMLLGHLSSPRVPRRISISLFCEGLRIFLVSELNFFLFRVRPKVKVFNELYTCLP